MQYVQLWCDKWCMKWNVMWWATCGVMFCVMWNELQCYCTMLCHITLPHGFVIRDGAYCGVVWCGICNMWCAVMCFVKWACGMWCGAMWNALQCYHTMLWRITPPHIAHHSCTFPHCTTPQQHNSTSDCTTFHISSCYTVQTMLCHIAPPCIAHHVM